MSEHLSEPFIEKHPYQPSYVMLIERSINLSLTQTIQQLSLLETVPMK